MFSALTCNKGFWLPPTSAALMENRHCEGLYELF